MELEIIERQNYERKFVSPKNRLTPEVQ